MTVRSCAKTQGNANSIPYTRKLKELSQFDVDTIIRKSLANDQVKTIDQYIYNQIKTTPLIFGASSGTDTENATLYTASTNSTANAATCWMHTGHIVSIVDQMKEYNIPSFDGEDYVCIAHPTTLTGLRGQLLGADQYTDSGAKRRLNGEIGRYAGMRFVEQTHVAKVTPTNAGAGSWAVFLGGEAVIEAISVPEEVLEKEKADFGRAKGFAWYQIAGYGLAWPAGDYARARVAMWWPNATSPND